MIAQSARLVASVPVTLFQWIPVYLRQVAMIWWEVIFPPIPQFRGVLERLTGLIFATVLSTPLLLLAAWVGDRVGAHTVAPWLVYLVIAGWAGLIGLYLVILAAAVVGDALEAE